MDTDRPEPSGDDQGWRGDATSVVEFLRPLREQLDAPGVMEVCVNSPGQLFIEATDGWHIVPAPAVTLERCLSLANAVATYCDQQINQERPLLSATLPTGERIQFAIPPAVSRDTVSITIRKPTQLIKRLDDFERERLFEHLTDRVGADRHSLLLELELLQLKTARRYADFLRLAVRRHQTIVVSGRTGSGKTTFMKGLIEEVPKEERLITIEDTGELTLPSHLVAEDRRFIKGLRYDLPSQDRIATATLTDCGAPAPLLYISSDPSDEASYKPRPEPAGDRRWQWFAHEERMPPLPLPTSRREPR